MLANWHHSYKLLCHIQQESCSEINIPYHRNNRFILKNVYPCFVMHARPWFRDTTGSKLFKNTNRHAWGITYFHLEYQCKKCETIFLMKVVYFTASVVVKFLWVIVFVWILMKKMVVMDKAWHSVHVAFILNDQISSPI